MKRDKVTVNGEKLYVINRGSCTTEVSKTPQPSDRLGSTEVVFNSEIDKE